MLRARGRSSLSAASAESARRSATLRARCSSSVRRSATLRACSSSSARRTAVIRAFSLSRNRPLSLRLSTFCDCLVDSRFDWSSMICLRAESHSALSASFSRASSLASLCVSSRIFSARGRSVLIVASAALARRRATLSARCSSSARRTAVSRAVSLPRNRSLSRRLSIFRDC